MWPCATTSKAASWLVVGRDLGSDTRRRRPWTVGDQRPGGISSAEGTTCYVRCLRSARRGYWPAMATNWRDPHPDSGPESHCALSEALLNGFVVPGTIVPFGHAKVIAGILWARLAAVEAALEKGPSASSMHDLATRLQMSYGWLQSHFSVKTALYAFPPPELAESLGGAGGAATSWAEVGPLVRPVFLAFDANPEGRSLLSGLVTLHRANHDLAACDGYFAAALHEQVRGHVSPRALSMVGFFTDGLRTAFGEWVDAGQPSLGFVADRVDRLLAGAANLQHDDAGNEIGPPSDSIAAQGATS